MVQLTSQPTPAPQTLWAWLQSILSEDTGHGSWVRVQGWLSWALAAALVTIATLTGNDIPPGAQTVLLGILTAAGFGYGANVTSSAFTARKAQQEAL